jgi:hypothetical protein
VREVTALQKIFCCCCMLALLSGARKVFRRVSLEWELASLNKAPAIEDLPISCLGFSFGQLLRVEKLWCWDTIHSPDDIINRRDRECGASWRASSSSLVSDHL